MTTTDATTDFRNSLAKRGPLIDALRIALDLSPGVHYAVGVLRTSVRSKEVLARQTDTGIAIFSHVADFVALGELSALETRPGWIEIRRCDLVEGAGGGVVGYLGLVGRTIFVAVHDSAIAGTLPPFPGDVAEIGRNAFTELALVCALAGRITDFYAPTRERWWRNDVYGYRLLYALMTNLPGLTIWEGTKAVDMSAAGAIGMSVEGSMASSKAAQGKEAAFEKALNDLIDGRWPRASHELPVGLRRRETDGRGLSRKVEVVQSEVVAMRVLLLMLADGRSYGEIGKRAAELGLAVPGPAGHTRTFADLDSGSRARSAQGLFTVAGLSYWETGGWVMRLHTALPLDRVGGHDLDYDQERKVRYKDVLLDKFPWPDGGFLDSAGWVKIRRRAESAESKRARNRGAAAQKTGTSAAFSGVGRWNADIDGREVECLFAPETPTAYRLRTRQPEVRGAGRREGKVVATLRRPLFDRQAGLALLERLESMTDEIAPFTPVIVDDPFESLRDELQQLKGQAEQSDQAANRWDATFETEDDPSEREVARIRAKQRRADATKFRARITQLERKLDDETAAMRDSDTTEQVTAQLTLPVLVADALTSSTGTVSTDVRDGLRRLGVLDTLRAEPDDITDPCGWWSLSATARIELAHGERVDVPFSWRVISTMDTTGTAAIDPMLVRAWLNTESLEQAAMQVAMTVPQADRKLRNMMRRRGIRSRGHRAAALICPVGPTRAVIAAHLLDDPALTDHVPAGWRTHIANTYWNRPEHTYGNWGSFWCAPALRESRQILTELEVAGREGLNIDAIARRTGLPTARVRNVIRTSGIANVKGHRATLRPCCADGCRGQLAHYLPTPETAPNGLICTTCHATELGTIAPTGYRELWEYVDNRLQIAAELKSGGRVHDDERRLSIGEAAELIGINDWVLRGLADNGEITCVRGRGPRGGPRMFRERDLRAIPAATIASWQDRGAKADQRGRLRTADAAALLGIRPDQLKPLIRLKLVDVERNAGGQRTFDPAQLRSIDPKVIDGLDEVYVNIGEVAARSGVASHLIRDLSDTGALPCIVSVTGTRRYDPEPTLEALKALGVTPGDDLILIGEAARMLNTTTCIVRYRSNEGVIPVHCTINDTRRYSRAAIQQLVDEGIPLTPSRLRTAVRPSAKK